MIQKNPKRSVEETAAEFSRIMSAGVQRAREENRRLGVPNVYSINGILYYELPDGSLSQEDPWQGKDTPPESADEGVR